MRRVTGKAQYAQIGADFFLSEDEELSAIAAERLARCDPSKTLSWEEVNRRFGITEQDLADCAEDEFE
ncbi:MAG: hypothetical protein IKN96_04860 [Oscillibacter sp.]|nr:hypothetical protein [Oscillibacter sp.]